jgi:hypothetical protein
VHAALVAKPTTIDNHLRTQFPSALPPREVIVRFARRMRVQEIIPEGCRIGSVAWPDPAKAYESVSERPPAAVSKVLLWQHRLKTALRSVQNVFFGVACRLSHT